MNLRGGPCGCLFVMGGNPLLKSCIYCSNYHQRGEDCPRKPVRIKEATSISKFRSGARWRKKSLEIRTLDLYLCQHCKSVGIYNFMNLEVHHIIPIAKDWNKRLENENLITLCSQCHTLAEDGDISTDKLYQLIKKRNEVGTQYERKF
jgi:5-methylcytosine-specific restriction enzyme A